MSEFNLKSGGPKFSRGTVLMTVLSDFNIVPLSFEGCIVLLTRFEYNVRINLSIKHVATSEKHESRMPLSATVRYPIIVHDHEFGVVASYFKSSSENYHRLK
jgi:hypothetical protein